MLFYDFIKLNTKSDLNMINWTISQFAIFIYFFNKTDKSRFIKREKKYKVKQFAAYNFLVDLGLDTGTYNHF